MANYYIVDRNSPYNDGQTVTVNGTQYTVIDIQSNSILGIPQTESVSTSAGNTYLISNTVTTDVNFAPASGAAEGTQARIELEPSTTGSSPDYDITFSDPLIGGSINPTIVVPQGGNFSSVNIRGENTDSMTVNVGDNASVGNIVGGGDNGDVNTVTSGAGSSITSYSSGDQLQLTTARDVLTINGTIGDINTRGGADQVTINGTATGFIDTGEGNDTVTINGTSGDIRTSGGDDRVTVTGTSGDVETGGGADSVTVSGQAGDVRTGDGQDTVTLNDGRTGDIETGGGSDLVNGTGGFVDGYISTRNTIETNINDAQANLNDTISFSGPVTIQGGNPFDGDLLNGPVAIITGLGDDKIFLGEGSVINGNITTGDNVIDARLDALDGSDTLVIGANSTVTGFIDTEEGNDSVQVGDGVTLNQSINTYLGNDTIIIGDNVDFTREGNPGDVEVFAGAGNDYVQFGTGNSAQDIQVDGGIGTDTLAAPSGTLANGTNVWGSVDATRFEEFVTIPCFTRGTLIETDRGAVAVETLQEGDLVATRDNGLQPVRWIGSRTLDGTALEKSEKLRPIRIRRHALGTDVPSSDLLVSPQHRVLVRSRIAQKMFGRDEILVAAKQLCQVDGIDVADDVSGVEYFHILFDRHEIVVSNGAETESLFTGPEALKSVGAAAREEIFALFPELKNRDYVPVAARAIATGRMGRKLAVRHQQNHKPLVS